MATLINTLTWVLSGAMAHKREKSVRAKCLNPHAVNKKKLYPGYEPTHADSHSEGETEKFSCLMLCFTLLLVCHAVYSSLSVI